MRVAILASGRAPLVAPFASPVEAHTHALVEGLRRRGIEVELFAPEGSDPVLQARPLRPSICSSGPTSARAAGTAEAIVTDAMGYLEAFREIRADRAIDLIHDCSEHPLPAALARTLDIPLITTLQRPGDPYLDASLRFCPEVPTIAVSETVAERWRHVTEATVIRPGLDLGAWPAGPGGGPLVWLGPLAPETAPHVAARIAHAAGRELRLLGPIADRDYFKQEVLPLLDKPVAYLGHFGGRELAAHLGTSAACLVTPAWEEPSAREALLAMSCGTPVLAIARGALREVVAPESGRLFAPDADDAATVDALDAVVALDRAAVRAHAEAIADLEHELDATIALYEAHRA